ncbi:MAG: hypothetical protein M1825_001900 [Sarcosagium campestre]|nr:MAG: hypothetical protein M1825_001900 [Sarcosagium campestre]
MVDVTLDFDRESFLLVCTILATPVISVAIYRYLCEPSEPSASEAADREEQCVHSQRCRAHPPAAPTRSVFQLPQPYTVSGRPGRLYTPPTINPENAGRNRAPTSLLYDRPFVFQAGPLSVAPWQVLQPPALFTFTGPASYHYPVMRRARESTPLDHQDPPQVEDHHQSKRARGERSESPSPITPPFNLDRQPSTKWAELRHPAPRPQLGTPISTFSNRTAPNTPAGASDNTTGTVRRKRGPPTPLIIPNYNNIPSSTRAKPKAPSPSTRSDLGLPAGCIRMSDVPNGGWPAHLVGFGGLSRGRTAAQSPIPSSPYQDLRRTSDSPTVGWPPQLRAFGNVTQDLSDTMGDMMASPPPLSEYSQSNYSEHSTDDYERPDKCNLAGAEVTYTYYESDCSDESHDEEYDFDDEDFDDEDFDDGYEAPSPRLSGIPDELQAQLDDYMHSIATGETSCGRDLDADEDKCSEFFFNSDDPEGPQEWAVVPPKGFHPPIFADAFGNEYDNKDYSFAVSRDIKRATVNWNPPADHVSRYAAGEPPISPMSTF